MKVVYFKRVAESFHIHAGVYTDCFFIPEMDVILYKEKPGTFGRNEYSFTESDIVLEEARKISGGKTPDVSGVSFSDRTVFDYDSSVLAELVSDAKVEKELNRKVADGIEKLVMMLG